MLLPDALDRRLPVPEGFVVVLLVVATGIACGPSYEAPTPPRGQIHYPVGLEIHPDGRFLYVVNSNFNSRYRPNAGGTVSVVDLRSMTIRDEGTPFIPSFGGTIELNDDASRAYVAIREGNQLAALRVSEQTASAPAGASVYCVDDEGEPTSDPSNCTVRRVPADGGTPFATDPFGLSVTTLRRDDPGTDDPSEVPVDLVGLSYVASNRVTAVSFPKRQMANASAETASLGGGGNAVTRRPDTLSHYVAGRDSNSVTRFAPYLNFREQGSFGEIEAIIRQRRVRVSNQRGGSSSIDARGVAFDDDGDRLFVASRQPDALYIFDLVPASARNGTGLRHELADTIPLDDDPSDVVLHRRADRELRIYVPSYDERTIDVVDPDVGRIVDAIELPASPYRMVVDTAPDRCNGDGGTCRAYVSLFQHAPDDSNSCDASARQCGSLGVIDLEPTSSRYHQLVRTLRGTDR